MQSAKLDTTSINLVSHWFDSAMIRTLNLPHGKPALYQFIPPRLVDIVVWILIVLPGELGDLSRVPKSDTSQLPGLPHKRLHGYKMAALPFQRSVIKYCSSSSAHKVHYITSTWVQESDTLSRLVSKHNSK